MFKKMLYLEWASFGNDYVKKALADKGIELVIYDFPRETEDTRGGEELALDITRKLMECNADAVFSLNYFPVAAIACKALNKKYISWTYDSPYIQLYSLTIEYPTNYAFIFDKAEYLKMRDLGIETVYYLPMAGPCEATKITDSEHRRYDADIAMIGSMYSEKKHRLIRHFEKVDEYTKGYIDGIMKVQQNLFGVSILETSLTPEIVKNIQKSCPVISRGDGFEKVEWVLANYFIARSLTARERHEYLDELSRHFKVALYTHEETPTLPGIDNRGPLDYYSEAPKAMKCAKINLNITLRSIITGIPLRVMDIMAAGGFVLTSYQEDMLDFFVPGEDYAYYDSKADLVDKCGYYLEHEEERERMARSAHDKVSRMHTYAHRIDKILETASLENNE